MCSSKKYPGKIKFSEGKDEVKPEFREGWGGSNQRTLCRRGMDNYF